jgi:hypothetical protein
MTRKQSIELASDLRSFFEDEVRSTAEKQGTDLSVHASRYLALVLERFTNVENFLSKNESNGDKHEFPVLALRWLEGLSTAYAQQLFHMQQLGDLALFTSGFFGDRIDRSLVDMDYYRAMGGQAYQRAGQIKESLSAEKNLNIFFELAAGFGPCVEIFAEVSERSSLTNNRDLLRLYEKWLAKGSARLSRMLAEKGIIASGGNRGDIS